MNQDFSYGMWVIVIYQVIAVFLIQWPLFLTMIMVPVLFFAYYYLSLHKEQLVHKQFGDLDKNYTAGKPLFFSDIYKWSDFVLLPRGGKF